MKPAGFSVINSYNGPKDYKPFWFSLSLAKDYQNYYGGTIVNENGELVREEPEPPAVMCSSCAATQNAFYGQNCWCCGDYLLNIIYSSRIYGE